MKALLFSSHPKPPIPCFPRLTPHHHHHHQAPLKILYCRTISAAASAPSAPARHPPPPRRKSEQAKSNPPRASSLYARPSLAEMKAARAATRAQVYDFLRSLGVVPDELDGLELPATVDVMRERVDFLRSLGLSVADINAYPLVLGCSVKKNMVPVLDYLGKIGVRRSALTDFLRRYPQVLHASVVVDLAPVVKYLQGMDIKPAHVPRVLERYPELLGFKLEGTMSTSVAYLIGIGVARRELGGVLTRYPEVLGMRVGRVIKPFVEHLEGIGLPTLAVARLIEKRPHILGFSLEDQVKPNVGALVEFGIKEESLASVVAQYPDILGMELRAKLAAQQSLFESSVLVDRDEFGRVIEKMPQAVSLSRSAILKHVEFLKSCGFLLKQVSKMVIGCPQLLALNLDIMKMSFEYFHSEMDRDLEELVDFPAFFTYGLESTIRPRNQMIVKKGLKCSLGWMLNCSDAKFEERMQYDSIGIEEVEAEPVFDMKTLLQPREEDESGSECDEDADYEDSDDDSF
ncbi:transcription termination factor MTERF4, chloroplastic [Ananas comosus]|uniref:Transcription termination factor MTERF4, chloroplastic n=1 Tax=Ananas comosus TaxID=4615 RepID=A0A6P5EUK2_ANACO|nr:transcription termination factor MTERF4, chloroplastic [Ananas comosus]